MRMSMRHVFHWCLIAVTLFLTLVSGKDYYHLLGLQRSASERQIKKAYRSLALEFHPDKVQGTAEEKEIAATKFAEINHAYEVLSDEKTRKIYDKYGEEGLKQHGDSGGHDAGDIFSQFFGGFGFGGQQAEPEAPRGEDVVVHVEATLRDIYVGRSLTITQTRNVYKKAPGTRQCNCKFKTITRQVGPGMYQQMQKQVCEECPNVALERESRELSVDIEPGMTHGQVITLYEEGEAHPDGDAGDLKLVLNLSPHTLFRREGIHLHYAATISLTEALVGFSRDIEHLDGHKVSLHSSGVTSTGDVVRIPNEGMPLYGNELKHGDLIVTYTVHFPSKLDKGQKEAVMQLFN